MLWCCDETLWFRPTLQPAVAGWPVVTGDCMYVHRLTEHHLSLVLGVSIDCVSYNIQFSFLR